MAIHKLFFLLSILLAFASISVNGRPCKTILFISSSSSSSFPANQNPNLLFPNPRFITFSYTTSLRQPFRKITFSGDEGSLNRALMIPKMLTPEKSTQNPHFLEPSVGNSIRDRTLDILSIVSALLFGVGCGALTAATMYLVWYICSGRSFDFGGDSDDEDDVSAAKKKLGYVAVPVDDVAVPVDDVAVPATAKQVE